jgi:hypothetical protein
MLRSPLVDCCSDYAIGTGMYVKPDTNIHMLGNQVHTRFTIVTQSLDARSAYWASHKSAC